MLIKWTGRKGLKILSKKGETTITKSHDIEGFQSNHWHEFTREERAKALKYRMYLKEKHGGRVKGRGCVDGWS